MEIVAQRKDKKTKAVNMAYYCPMCREKFTTDLKAYVEHVEDEIVHLIRQDHPDWDQEDGTCPKCYEYYKKQLKG